MSVPPTTASTRDQLVAVARDLFTHAEAGTIPLADDVVELPASRCYDPEHFERERRLIFRRVPVVVAATCEIPNPGDRVGLDVAGIPVLVVRGRDGSARAFLNACTHRGAVLTQGNASSARIKCPDGGRTSGWHVPASEVGPWVKVMPTCSRSPATTTTPGRSRPCCSASGSSTPTCRSTRYTRAGVAS